MIAPLAHPPNGDNALQLQIADTWEESREEAEEDRANVQVYSDGSGIEGMAVAAAVLFGPVLQRSGSLVHLISIEPPQASHYL